jgi:hypothetical protein
VRTTSSPPGTRPTLVPITAEISASIGRFNERMAAGGSAQRLHSTRPFPLIAEPSDPITIHHLAYVIGDEARGGVNVKQMPFQVVDRTEPVAFYNRPLSEGIVDPRFGMLGVYIQKEVCRRFPLVYGLGVGDLGQPVARLMIAGGWSHSEVPFHFAVFHAGRFLRNLTPLRTNPVRRKVGDVAAGTGIGALGLQLLSLVQVIRRRRPSVRGLTIREFDEWEEWADELWRTNRHCYSLVSERSARTMRILYPRDNSRYTKLRVSDAGGRTLGWVVVTVNTLQDHHYFGNARLGAIIDMFGHPDHARAIISAGVNAVREADADLVVVNQANTAWNAAISEAGLLPWKTNWYLFLSPKLAARLHGPSSSPDKFFFTRGDGDGPINLW